MGQPEYNGHDSTEKYGSEQLESRPVAAKASFGQKAKRHCARFWWVHLIVFCIVFLIIALCLVYVGLPRIAQHDVDASSLEFTELKFLNPTDTSIVLTQEGVLKNPSKFTPTLDEFNATLFLVTNGTWSDVPMLTIPMPSIHAKKTTPVTLEAKTLAIENVDQLTEFSTQVLKNEYVTTGLVGKTKLHLGALPDTTVNYKEATTYKGLNRLQGFNVTNVKMNLRALPGTPNLSGFAYIPNPSVMTIAMGNVTLTLSTASAGVIGNSTINDMTLVPGNNTLPMTGILEAGKVLTSLVDGFVDLVITGRDAVYNGIHLTYYEKALASNNLTLHMNVNQILADSS